MKNQHPLVAIVLALSCTLAVGAGPSEKQLREAFAKELGFVKADHVTGVAVVALKVTKLQNTAYCPFRTSKCGMNPQCGHRHRAVQIADYTVAAVKVREGKVDPPKLYAKQMIGGFRPATFKVAKGDTLYGAVIAYTRSPMNLTGVRKIAAAPTTQPAGKDKVRTIRLKNAPGQVGLKKLNKFTHIYSFSNDQAWIQFSFGKRPFDEKDALAAIRREWKYANLEVRFPEKKTDNARVYAQLLGPLRQLGKPMNSYNMKGVKVEVTAFNAGRLQGTFTGTITKLTTRTRGPGLRTGDIAGVGHKADGVEIPFVLEFDLSVDSKD